jgi:hypothetical protein
MQMMRNRVKDSIAAMDPAETLRIWMPAMGGFEQIQEFFSKISGVKRDK